MDVFIPIIGGIAVVAGVVIIGVVILHFKYLKKKTETSSFFSRFKGIKTQKVKRNDNSNDTHFQIEESLKSQDPLKLLNSVDVEKGPEVSHLSDDDNTTCGEVHSINGDNTTRGDIVLKMALEELEKKDSIFESKIQSIVSQRVKQEMETIVNSQKVVRHMSQELNSVDEYLPMENDSDNVYDDISTILTLEDGTKTGVSDHNMRTSNFETSNRNAYVEPIADTSKKRLVNFDTKRKTSTPVSNPRSTLYSANFDVNKVELSSLAVTSKITVENGERNHRKCKFFHAGSIPTDNIDENSLESGVYSSCGSEQDKQHNSSQENDTESDSMTMNTNSSNSRTDSYKTDDENESTEFNHHILSSTPILCMNTNKKCCDLHDVNDTTTARNLYTLLPLSVYLQNTNSVASMVNGFDYENYLKQEYTSGENSKVNLKNIKTDSFLNSQIRSEHSLSKTVKNDISVQAETCTGQSSIHVDNLIRETSRECKDRILMKENTTENTTEDIIGSIEFEMESNVINSHNNTAQNSSNITFKCSTCPKKTFKHSIDVKTHLFDVHVQCFCTTENVKKKDRSIEDTDLNKFGFDFNKDKYSCKVCKKLNVSKKEIRKHIVTVHELCFCVADHLLFLIKSNSALSYQTNKDSDKEDSKSNEN